MVFDYYVFLRNELPTRQPLLFLRLSWAKTVEESLGPGPRPRLGPPWWALSSRCADLFPTATVSRLSTPVSRPSHLGIHDFGFAIGESACARGAGKVSVRSAFYAVISRNT
jgi:hypothetical protein